MRTFIIGICLILTGYNTFSQNILRQQVEDTYLSQVGVLEQGLNSGTMVDQYLGAVSLKPGNAWCAAFVAWVYQQNGVVYPHSGWSPSWFAPQHVVWSRDGLKNRSPLPGDVFGIYFAEKKRIAHVGFVHRFGATVTITVEGNTNNAGSREGDGVYLKRRPTRQLFKIARYINDIP